MAIKITVWDLLGAAAKFDGSPTVNEDVAAILKKYGHSSGKVAGCTATVMAMFYAAGDIGAVGGYGTPAATAMANAKKAGIWHAGKSGILPGDVVIFGRNGKSNHSELAVGEDLDVSGNYNDACSRRKRSSHSSSILGYIRPKYAAMGAMGELELTIAAVDVMLGVYGSGAAREKNLAVFGAANAKAIQVKVDSDWGDSGKVAFDMAVYTIAGRAGKGTYRKSRLGPFYAAAMDKVNEIYALRTRTHDQAAQDVLDGKYGNGAVRALLLSFNGFDSGKVQEKVNALVAARETAQDVAVASGGVFRVWPIWFFESDEAQFGDATAIIEYTDATKKEIAHCILVDTAKKASDTVRKLKAAGVKTIDAVFLSHAHGDHYGALSDVCKAFPVKHIYLPPLDGLDKYQKSYANALRRQGQKAGSSVLTVGQTVQIGSVKVSNIWQAPAGDLKEHDDHHFVNNQSMVLRFNLGGVIYHTAGDLQNEGNNLLVKTGKTLNADIYKCQWHGDANACNETICKAVRPKIAFSNYHHKEGSGRGTTRKRLEAVGAVVYRNAEDGDIYIDCAGKKITVTTTKSGKHDTYTV